MCHAAIQNSVFQRRTAPPPLDNFSENFDVTIIKNSIENFFSFWNVYTSDILNYGLYKYKIDWIYSQSRHLAFINLL